MGDKPKKNRISDDGKNILISGDTHLELKDLKWEMREETFDAVLSRLIKHWKKENK